MKIKLKITLTNEDGQAFMGIGLVWLLREIEQCHSIHGAAARVGLSYVKALKILNRLEDNLSKKLVLRSRGGHQRGGAELTPYGHCFLSRYDVMQGRIKDFAQQQFHTFSKEFFV
jgi:molybdate transport system regulatory protein